MEQLTSQEIAQNWVTWLDALASGQYKKTTQRLWDIMNGERRYCCLGVAQVVLDVDKVNGDQAYRDIMYALGLRGIYGLRPTGCQITHLNDCTYDDDTDFVNMHRELLEDINGFTYMLPEVAPLVKNILSQRNA